MSFTNPTPLRVGAKGTLHGWTMTVVGRVVLGVEIEGERYYWNEYNLADATGHTGTLVYEEGDDGPEWKLFQLLPPLQTPMTVAEAETKRVGDKVDFGSGPIPVTLVDRSRVYHIEGTPPEGVELGDLADFFNADAGDHMIVASWTGNEIEFYDGRDVPTEAIATAFGLPRGTVAFTPEAEQFFKSAGPQGAAASGVGRVLRVVFSLLGLSAIWSIGSCLYRGVEINITSEPARKKQPAPALRLANGASGNLGSNPCTVQAQALVEVGRIAGRYDRREYQLATDSPTSVLLVNGLTGGSRQWHLLLPVTPPPGFSSYDAAARRKGAQVKLDGATATVTELFLSKALSVTGSDAPSLLPSGRQYGLIATSGAEWWLARWNEQGLSLYRGTALDEKTVLASLGPGPEKPK